MMLALKPTFFIIAYLFEDAILFSDFYEIPRAIADTRLFFRLVFFSNEGVIGFLLGLLLSPLRLIDC